MKKIFDMESRMLELWGRYSIRRIASILDINVVTVWRWAKKLGLPRKTSALDLTNKIMGDVTVIKLLPLEGRYRVYRCQCKCGNMIDLTINQLKDNKTPCCPKCYENKYVGGFLDLTGKKFGRLEVIERGDNIGRRVAFRCRCTCGNIKNIMSQNLRNGTTVSCGCLSKEKARENYDDITGRKFNRLTVISRVGRKWLCRCQCGNETIVRSTSLLDGRVKSCGCYLKEILSGENSRFWKGGVSSRNMESRLGSASRIWAAAVKKRDGYTCQKCGDVGAPLDYKMAAHHIRSFSQNKDLRLVVDNGITFCTKCHNIFHDIYGDNTTEKQLKAFLKKGYSENRI